MPELVYRPGAPSRGDASSSIREPTRATSPGRIPARIRIYDTTLRDGEQTPGVAMTAEQKVLIATELSRLGSHIIDVGFPASGESERRALQLILSARERGAIQAGSGSPRDLARSRARHRSDWCASTAHHSRKETQ
jgi:hypothetical protein